MIIQTCIGKDFVEWCEWNVGTTAMFRNTANKWGYCTPNHPFFVSRGRYFGVSGDDEWLKLCVFSLNPYTKKTSIEKSAKLILNIENKLF